jgi:hypothetical protein
MTNDTGFYTTRDLAKRWDRSPDRVRQFVRAGRLRPYLVTASGIRVFDEPEVQRFEHERERAAREKVTA